MKKENYLKKIGKNFFAIGLLSIFLLFFSLASESKAYTSVRSYMGKNRQETSSLISQKAYPFGAKSVVISSGLDFPDALASGPLLKALNCPILLNNSKEKLDSLIEEEIERLKPRKAIIIGGEFKLSNRIFKSLENKGLEVIRLAGSNRYETSRKIQEYIFTDPKEVKEAIITTGENFPDALSASTYASQKKIPLIITDKLGKIAIEDLKNYPNLERVIILGGKHQISERLDKMVGNSIRISGDNRFETNKKFNELLYPDEKEIYISSASNFADSLSGVSLFKDGGAIVLVEDKLSQAKLPDDVRISILGGRVLNDKTLDNVNPEKKERVTIFVNPHQDDETLTLGQSLINHYRKGTKMYLIQETIGEKSQAILAINNILQKKGYNRKINISEFLSARNSDLLAALSHVGFTRDCVKFVGHREYEIDGKIVARDIEQFIEEKRLGEKDITLVAVHEPYSPFEGSVGDHLATAHGAEIVANKFGYGLELWIVPRKRDYPGHFRFDMKEEDKDLYDKMLGEYRLWDPDNERYSTGYISVKNLFDFRDSYKTTFRYK